MSLPNFFLRGAVVALAVASLAGAELKVGDSFPAFRAAGVTNLAGGELPATEGKVVLVDFWASWCTPCKLSFPWMNQMHEQLGAQGLRIVAINLDRKEADAQRFLAQAPARFAIAMDAAAETAKLLAIQAMPTSLLVAADRSVLFTHRGFKLEDRADLEAKLRATLK